MGETATAANGRRGNVTALTLVVLLLLFLAAVINYVDRGSLSVAGPALVGDFGLSKVQLGVLLSSFFMTYAVFQIAAGWLVDRFSVATVFAAGFALWSLSTLLCGLARNADELFACRLLLGVGESVAFPCFARIVAGCFPAERRGLPNAVIDAGTKIGPALGVLIGGHLVGGYGWRAMFFVMGGASLVWLVPWLIWGPRVSDATALPQGAGGPTFGDVLRCRDAWGTFLGAACYTYAYFFLLTWLPSYLVEARGLSLSDMGTLASVPFLLSALAAVAAGWASDRWIARGASVTRARKTMVVAGLVGSIAALPAALAPTVPACFAFLCVAYVAFGVFASNLWAISQTLAGAAAGKWAGVQNSIGAATGVAAPIVTGLIVERTGSYTIAFAVTALLAVVGAAAYLFIVGPIRPVDWTARALARTRPPLAPAPIPSRNGRG